MDKLTSRKFWISVAAMLGSIATSIAGLTTDNQTVAIVGVVCAMFSAAIYAGCEAYVDKTGVELYSTPDKTTTEYIYGEDGTIQKVVETRILACEDDESTAESEEES